MSVPSRVITTLVVLAAAVVGIVFAALALVSQPSTIDFSANHQAGQPVHITLQTVGSIGTGDHPTWVSYLTQSPQGQWVHTTLWQVPEHTRIDVTIYQYDSGSPLRNQQIGQVTGTLGEIALLNGRPFHIINSNATTGFGSNGVGHTFSIPQLRVSVPLYGNNPNANLCGVAPCTTKSPHNIIRFSFMSPGPGNYPWQCFVPCALGWLYGNAGPMQTVGYMGGFMKVVA
jgi:hypothetical protein